MKSMTDGERILLEHMEQAAAHMHDLRSMLELFLELCPFSCEGLSADGQRQRRLLGLRFLSGQQLQSWDSILDTVLQLLFQFGHR